MLWIPALGVSARHYLPLADALAQRSIALALHEPRGGGSSSWRASRRCDWGYREVLKLDLPATFEAARTRVPAIDWFVGGHSIGGQFAALFAAMHPQQVAGIALVASGSPYWRAFRRPQRWALFAALAAVPVITKLAGRYPGRRLGFAGNEATSLMRDWARSGRTGNYCPSGMHLDLEAAMRTADLPMFGIGLEDDALCPRQSLDWLLSKFTSAEVESVTLSASAFASAAATHFSWMKDVDPVADRLAAWILHSEGHGRSRSHQPSARDDLSISSAESP